MITATADTALDPRLRLDTQQDPPMLDLHGRWLVGAALPDAAAVVKRLQSGSNLALRGDQIERWDTSIAAFVSRLDQAVQANGGQLLSNELPAGAQRLMRLLHLSNPAAAVSASITAPLLVRFGQAAVARWERFSAWLALVGSTFMAMFRFFTGRARVPSADVFEQLHECGPRALPIVTLLSFLIGGITAFVGIVQLRMFGAEIYVADLVAMGMLLEMGALMTAIIMAGRAGAAFAAALGTMQTNEEVDALQTLGFDPVEFLVMPRLLALTIMGPLLTLYADLLGILGGAFVGMTMLDLSPTTYMVQTVNAMNLSDAVKGVLKGLAFGALIAFAGCLRGIECGRSASAVGRATTSAVVTAIVLIVLADAFITVLYFIYDGML
jgi:phospholipid/cholesterol/gamma-HCH transport system permease protein